MDYYENIIKFYKRLREEYIKYKRLIIAVDFDDTLSDFHNTGKKHDHVISVIKRWEKHAFIYLWTARDETRQLEVIDFCYKNQIPFENINLGCPDVDFGSRKPFYNVLLDDRAGLMGVVNVLEKLIGEIERGEL